MPTTPSSQASETKSTSPNPLSRGSEIRNKLTEVKTQLNLNELKKSVTETIKDPDAQKAFIALVLTALLAPKTETVNDPNEQNKGKQSEHKNIITSKTKKQDTPEKEESGLCMTTNEVCQKINSNEKLSFLRDGAIGFSHSITKILKRAGDILGMKSKTKAINKVAYNWDVHRNSSGLGERQCARTVGNILGFGEGSHGYMSVTQNMVPALIAGNMERTGRPGIVFGFKNYKKGDVIVFKGGNREGDYNKGRFSHVGIVRDILTIDGGKYIAMEHDAKNLYVDLIPVNSKSANLKGLRKKLRNPVQRRKLIKQNQQLAAIYDFRKGSNAEYVRVRRKTDASVQREGKIAFAIRTSTLT